MRIFIILCFFLIFINAKNEAKNEEGAAVDFETAMKDLENLEKYITEYKKEKSPTQSLTHLIVCYIREGAYDTMEWTIAGGANPQDLPDYIKARDESEGTNAQATRTIRDFLLPTGEPLDFVHFFAVMNGIEYSKSFTGDIAHLVGWGGDAFQLLVDIKDDKGDLETLMNIAKTKYFRIVGGFDLGDYISDLDAVVLLNKKTDDNTFTDLMREYYTGTEYKKRVKKFIELTFPTLKSKDKFREVLFNAYCNDIYIKIMECKDGLREGTLACYVPGDLYPQYTEHQKAALYVVSDYLAENFADQSDESIDKTTEAPSSGESSEGPNQENYSNSSYKNMPKTIFNILSLLYMI